MRHTMNVSAAMPSSAPAGPESSAQRRRGRRRQHLAAFLANLTSMCAGVAMGWTSPALPTLFRAMEAGNGNETGTAAATPPFSLTEEEASWVSALVPAGALLGALPIGALADAFGRKTMLLSLALPYFVGWLVIAFANGLLWMMYFGRFLTGLGVGATTVLVPLYCEEIAEVAIRGALGTYLAFSICLGILRIYVLGAYFPYFWYTVSGCETPIMFLISFFWMPESPIFLASKGRSDLALKALEWLRGGPSYEVQLEADNITSSFKDHQSNSTNNSLRMFFSSNPLKSTSGRAFVIVLGIMLFQQLSGINAVIFHTVKIFNEAGSTLSGEASSIIIAHVQVVTVLCSSFVVDRLGRRFLLLLSTIALGLCLMCLSLYSYFFKEPHVDNSSIVLWIPLVSLIVYVIVFSLGLGPLPFLLMAELLPVNAKGWASAFAMSFNWLIALALTKEFPLMLEHLGQDITYGILSSFCLLGAIFVGKFLPETKGKTKSEIEESIGGDKP